MKIEIKKIVVQVDLGEYNEAFSGQTLDVWVNPTRNTLNTWDDLSRRSAMQMDLLRQAANKRDEDPDVYSAMLKGVSDWHTDEYATGVNRWYAALWSHGDEEPRHWTPEELVALDQSDPALYQWMRDKTWALIRQHREREKKA